MVLGEGPQDFQTGKGGAALYEWEQNAGSQGDGTVRVCVGTLSGGTERLLTHVSAQVRSLEKQPWREAKQTEGCAVAPARLVSPADAMSSWDPVQGVRFLCLLLTAPQPCHSAHPAVAPLLATLPACLCRDRSARSPSSRGGLRALFLQS